MGQRLTYTFDDVVTVDLQLSLVRSPNPVLNMGRVYLYTHDNPRMVGEEVELWVGQLVEHCDNKNHMPSTHLCCRGVSPTAHCIPLGEKDRYVQGPVSWSDIKLGPQGWVFCHRNTYAVELQPGLTKLIEPVNAWVNQVCKRCNAGNPYALPNQKDGTYLCYECR